MGYYFPQYNPAYRVIEQIRLSFLGLKRQKIDEDLVSRAAREISRMATNLDRSAYHIAQDINHSLFGDSNTRVVLLTSGTLLGETNLDAVVGSDLGNNPWRLFKSDSPESIDSRIASEKAHDFLSEKSNELISVDLSAFKLKSGRFFYFSDSQISKFLDNGEIDMVQLLPLLTFTPHVGLESVDVPIHRKYVEMLPAPFFSYRLKKSLQPKLSKILTYATIKDKEVIHDWLAYRIVAETEEKASQLHNKIMAATEIGKGSRTKIQFIDGNDYYKHTKPNGYKAFNDIYKVQTRGYNPGIVEVQIVDAKQYFRNEINPNDSAFHLNQEKKKRPSKHALSDAEAKILRTICGDSSLTLVIKPN